MLVDARSTLDFPPTPDLRQRVSEQITQRAPARTVSLGLPRSASLALLTIVVVAALTVLMARDVRDGIAAFLGLAVEGERIETLPTPAGPATEETPGATVLETVAKPATMAEAAIVLGVDVALPESTETVRFYLLEYADVVVVVAAYPSFDLWQARLDGHFAKGIPVDGTEIEQVDVSGHPAYWITGGPRLIRYVDANGTEVAGTQRSLSRNTLVWATESRYYRIETELSLERAMDIAQQLP